MKLLRHFNAGPIPIGIMLLALCLALIVIQSQLQLNKSKQIVPVLPTPTQIPGAHITVSGTFMCLPHKDQTGIQTMECAFGLMDDNKTYYGLRDSDPGYKNISSVPGNSRVTIDGMFYPQDNEKYPTVGTIEIFTLKQL